MTADPARYRVLTDELNWPADAAIVARLRAGESIPMDERGEIRTARRGEVISDVPPGSVGWLIDQGLIEPVAATAARKGVMRDGDTR